jgi:hypothetical protein
MYPRKTQSSIVKDVRLQLRCLAIDVVLFCAFASAGTCLQTPSLAMGVHVTVFYSLTGLGAFSPETDFSGPAISAFSRHVTVCSCDREIKSCKFSPAVSGSCLSKTFDKYTAIFKEYGTYIWAKRELWKQTQSIYDLTYRQGSPHLYLCIIIMGFCQKNSREHTGHGAHVRRNRDYNT